MGIGGNLEMWAPFQRALDGYGIQTVTFDAPGTGESTGWRRPRRMPAIATLVEHLLDGLGYDRLDVLGVSFGGGIAQQLAHQAPGRIRRLVLAATMPGLGGVPGNPRTLLALATPRRYRDPDHFRTVAGGLYGGRIRREPELLRQDSHARFGRPPSTSGYAAQLYAGQGWSSMRWLHRLPHVTLVMNGDDDPIIPLVNGRILAWRMPHARLFVVRGGGHLFLLDSSEDVAEVIAEFLAEPA